MVGFQKMWGHPANLKMALNRSILNDSVIVWPGVSGFHQFQLHSPHHHHLHHSHKYTSHFHLLVFLNHSVMQDGAKSITHTHTKWSWHTEKTAFLFQHLSRQDVSPVTSLFCRSPALFGQHAALQCKNGTCKAMREDGAKHLVMRQQFFLLPGTKTDDLMSRSFVLNTC